MLSDVGAEAILLCWYFLSFIFCLLLYVLVLNMLQPAPNSWDRVELGEIQVNTSHNVIHLTITMTKGEGENSKSNAVMFIKM